VCRPLSPLQRQGRVRLTGRGDRFVAPLRRADLPILPERRWGVVTTHARHSFVADADARNADQSAIREKANDYLGVPLA
jgi:hypothetical protein